jgi:hypothetical protein
MIPPMVRSVVMLKSPVAWRAAEVLMVMTKSPGLVPTGSTATSSSPLSSSTTRSDLY